MWYFAWLLGLPLALPAAGGERNGFYLVSAPAGEYREERRTGSAVRGDDEHLHRGLPGAFRPRRPAAGPGRGQPGAAP